MTLLTVVNDVCAAVGVHQTTSVVANINANRTMFEMLALANEMAQRIAYDMRDWTLLRTGTVLTGDGVLTQVDPPPAPMVMVGTSAFNLPANYKRMLLTTNVWRSDSPQHPMQFIPDTDMWFQRRMSAQASGIMAGSWGEWTILAGQMHIFPIMAAGITATFPYLDKNCIILTSGGTGPPWAAGDVFQNDLDQFYLDERLLKLGMIWQWKANKGSPYAEDMGTWGDAMANAMGKDSPSPIIVDRMPITRAWGGQYGYY